jgi:lipoprotein-anchoring transpeptidase ErfK/SrfK
MKRRGRRRLLLIVLIVVAILAAIGGGTAYAAYRYDQNTLDLILPGVTVEGVHVGGMTRDEAIDRVRKVVDRRLNAPVTVEAAGKTWETSSAELNTKAEVASVVDQAMALSGNYSWVQRVYLRMTGKPVGESFEVPLRFDKSIIEAYVAELGGEVGRAPVSGGLQLRGDHNLVFVKSRPGRELDVNEALVRLRRVLREETSTVKLPVRVLKPKTSGKETYTIVVRLDQNKLYLYKGKKVEKVYPVATGSPGFPTPEGSFQIVEKRKNPTWVNPDPNGWGASMPAEIPPGPGNPLGTRALNLNAPGIRIHGTYDLASLGTYASHGCIRMSIKDVEQLYEIVDVGTPVLIFD